MGQFCTSESKVRATCNLYCWDTTQSYLEETFIVDRKNRLPADNGSGRG